MKLNKKACCYVALGTALCCAATLGCYAFAGNFDESQSNAFEVSAENNELTSGRDLTVAVENTFDPHGYSERMYSCGVSDSAIGDSLEELSGAAEEVIQGRIVSLDYFAFEGRAHTKADILVEKAISGSLQKGDTISVFLRQGYISLSEQVAWEKKTGGVKFEYSKEELENTVIVEYELGEELAKVGDDAIFFLAKNSVESMGGYARVCGGNSEFLYDSKNDDYERAATMDRDEEEGDNFSLSEIESAVKEAE